MTKIREIKLCNDRRPLDSNDDPPQGLVNRPTGEFCVLDSSGKNTGMQGWMYVGLYDEVNEEWVGATFPNRPDNSPYFPPTSNPSACPIPGNISVDPPSLSVAWGETEHTFSITANQAWELTNFSPGLSFNKTSGSGNTTISVLVAANQDSFEISKFFTLRTTGGASTTVTISQGAYNYDQLDVIPTSLTFDSEGGVQQVQVITEQPWTFSDDLFWGNVTRVGNGLSVEAYKNFDGPRYGSITVSGDVSQAFIPITQEAVPVFNIILFGRGTQMDQFDGAPTPDEAMNNTIQKTVYSTTPEEEIGIGTRFFLDDFDPLNGGNNWYRLGGSYTAIQIDPDGYWIASSDTTIELTTVPTSLPNIAGEGETRSLTVQSNTSWEVASKSAWITVNGDDFGTGNGSLSLTFASNPGSSPRSGSIRIASTDGLRETVVMVNQGLAFTISPTEWTAPSANGGTFTLNIETYGPWEAQFQEGHPVFPGTVYPENGSGNGSVQVTVEHNTSQNPVIRFLEVFSQGRVRICYITVPGANFLNVVPVEQRIAAKQTAAEVEITSNTEWIVDNG